MHCNINAKGVSFCVHAGYKECYEAKTSYVVRPLAIKLVCGFSNW